MALKDFYRPCPERPRPTYPFGQTPDGTPRTMPKEMSDNICRALRNKRPLSSEQLTGVGDIKQQHTVEVSTRLEHWTPVTGWKARGVGPKLSIKRSAQGLLLRDVSKGQFSLTVPMSAGVPGGKSTVDGYEFSTPSLLSNVRQRYYLRLRQRGDQHTRLVFSVPRSALNDATPPAQNTSLHRDLIATSSSGRGITKAELQATLRAHATTTRSQPLEESMQQTLRVAVKELSFATTKTRQLALRLGRGHSPAQVGIVVGSLG